VLLLLPRAAESTGSKLEEKNNIFKFKKKTDFYTKQIFDYSA
jgi:hypothetical protein